MKAALIPPIPELARYGTGDFHLLLTHLLIDPAYEQHYLDQRRKGAYLILDNSAHEYGEGDKALDLMRKAANIGAQEVVVPDVLFDAERTIERAVQAHEAWYEGRQTGMLDLAPALMYVPQGKTIEEWEECMAALISIHHHSTRHHSVRQACVLGISKDYEMWDGGIERLIEEKVVPFLVAQKVKYGQMPHVHLLGWGRQLWALRTVAERWPWIRSTDSAKPFVYALKKTYLESNGKVPRYPTRPRNYFDRRLNAGQRLCAEHNIQVFRQVAGGV